MLAIAIAAGVMLHSVPMGVGLGSIAVVFVAFPVYTCSKELYMRRWWR